MEHRRKGTSFGISWSSVLALLHTYFWTSVEAIINTGLLLVTFPNPDLYLVDSMVYETR